MKKNKKENTTIKMSEKKNSKKISKKRRVASTLIELLAVIVIIGVLMLIAIPSVTNYINESRKNAYVNTAKQYIKGATQLVNSGELEVYDTGVTYYIPSTCIALETGGESPYGGKFEPAYIIVTYDNNSYNYYWMSRDNQSMGVKLPTLSDNLNTSVIESGVTKDDIKANISVQNRNRIIVLSEDCSSVEKTSSAERKLNTSGNQIIDTNIDNSGDYLMAITSYSDASSAYMRTTISKNKIETITFSNSLQGHVPNNNNCWDVSAGETGATLIWSEDSDNNGLYEITIGSEDGVILTSGTRLFLNLTNLKSISGLENLDTSKATNMAYMFQECDSLTSLDLRYFDTSNVTNMTQMFYDMDNLTSLNITSFDTSKVTRMDYMFRLAKKIKVLDLSSFSKESLTHISYIFANCSQLETIYVNSSFDFSSATSTDFAFWDDRNLVGGAGTTFSSDHKDSSYGHIDGGPSNPGYFSTK